MQYKEKCQTLRRRAENNLLMRLFMYRSERSRKTELSCRIIDADDEWIKICYTEKKGKKVVKLMRIENIDAIEEQ